MFTKNYNIAHSNMTTGKITLATDKFVVYTGETLTVVDAHMGGRNLDTLLGSVSTSGWITTTATYGVKFGSGTTPPTVDDYTLSGDLVTAFTYTNVRNYNLNEDGSITVSAVYTLTSTASKDIFIGEICLFDVIKGKTATISSSKLLPVILDRTVLDNPVTIPPGGVGVVTYTITIPAAIT